ncbi:MAG: ABC transporter permease [Lachnospiraceae bacterium]|nr:ABC transporter permease [Lachnospiraceae bacterium]
MRKFGIVLKYELKEYFSSKGFMVLTFVIAFLGAALLFLPRFIDMSDFTGVQVVGEKEEPEEVTEEDMTKFAYIDLTENGVLQEELLQQMIPDVSWHKMNSLEELKQSVEEECDAGFAVTGPTEYDYYVFNKSMMDSNTAMFDEVMKQMYRLNYCAENGLDLAEITEMYNVPITVNEQIMNKDSGSNYWYCYVLVIIVFMLIVYYGQMIAVSVTNEKSNRAIEVLVTSTTPNSLLFGKVIAGAIGGLFQMGFILGAVLISYSVNREQWGGMLDMFLHVPAEVLLAFAFFGLGGYLFYAFLYGAMGALVSKTEDISKTVSGLMMVIMVVYFFSLMQLTNIDGTIIKVLSFLPVSSYSTMFARIAMGTVASWEIIVSFLILVASIFGAGVLGAKIYRMGTLRYGNPISLTKALKDLKKSE